MSPIETHVRGDVGAVRDAARWFRELRSDGVGRANDHAAAAQRESHDRFGGDAATNYRGLVKKMYDDAEGLERPLSRAAGLVDDYAGALQRTKDAMERIRGRATAGGLEVAEYWIEPPAPPLNLSEEVLLLGDSPDNPYRAEFREHQEAVAKQELFEELRGEAHELREGLTDWVEQYLRPMVEFVGGEDLLGWKGDIGGFGRFGVNLTENLAKDTVGAVKGIPDIPKHLYRIGDTGYTLLDGAVESGRTGDGSHIGEAATSETTGRGIDAAMELGKKTPLRIGVGSLAKTVIDAGTGELIEELADDPELPPRAPRPDGQGAPHR